MSREDIQNSTYAGLFSEVSEKLDSNQMDIGCSENGYLNSIGASPKVISFKRFEKLEGEVFLSSMYLSVFQRLPSEKERKIVEGMSKEEILKLVVNKGSFSVRKIQFTDCPYKNVKIGLRGRIIGCASTISKSTLLRKIAKSMPSGLQNIIRELFG